MSEEKKETEGVPTEAAQKAAELIKESFGQIVETVSETWEKIRPVIEGMARDAATIAAAYNVLGEVIGAASDPYSAEDEVVIKVERNVREHLKDMDDEQLKDVENAFVAASLLVSRKRKEQSR